MRACVHLAYLSSSSPLGPWSICSPAPSPAPSSELCTDSPLCVSGAGKPGSPQRGSPGRPQLHDPPASPSLPQRSSQLTPVWTCWFDLIFFFFFNCPAPASARCRVPLAPAGQPVRAQRNPVHSPAAGSDLTCVSSSLPPPPSTRLCVCACVRGRQREMRVYTVGVCATGLSFSLSLSVVPAPVGGSTRTSWCFPEDPENGCKNAARGSGMNSVRKTRDVIYFHTSCQLNN